MESQPQNTEFRINPENFHPWNIEILNVASLNILLSNKGTTKALISLCRCAGWSVPLLYICNNVWFSCDKAQ